MRCVFAAVSAQVKFDMDCSTQLSHRFKWADVTLHTLMTALGQSGIQRSLLCNSNGSDTDFSGGASAFEHAALMIESAGRASGIPIDLSPKSICEPGK